jgi:SAM-dependent methyltransferase
VSDLYRDGVTRAQGAAVFAQPDVVASYHGRQPYAPAAYDALMAVVPARGRALDIGCGPGFLTGELAKRFDEVVAVDPSAPMIAAGRAACSAANIRWVCARAEDLEDDQSFDLAIAGSSIHWTEPAVLFPKLARWTSLVAIVGNDPWFPYPPPPCGLDAWVDFLARWNGRVGREIPPWWRNLADRPPPRPAPFEAWLDLVGREEFRFAFRQTIADFVASCHARVSWPRQMMGEALAAAFDAELTELLSPHAVDGLIELDIITDLGWGAPRATPRQ